MGIAFIKNNPLSKLSLTGTICGSPVFAGSLMIRIKLIKFMMLLSAPVSVFIREMSLELSLNRQSILPSVVSSIKFKKTISSQRSFKTPISISICSKLIDSSLIA